MKTFIKAPVFASLMLAGGFAAAQSERIDVTLEVLDDISEIDAVVVRLEDSRDRSEDPDRDIDERLDREQFDGAGDDNDGRDAEVFDRDGDTERNERREQQNDEETLERDFENEDGEFRDFEDGQRGEDGESERETDADRDDLIDSVENDSAAE